MGKHYEVRYNKDADRKKWEVYLVSTLRRRTVDRYVRKSDAQDRAKELGSNHGRDVDVYDRSGRSKTNRFCYT